MSDSNLISLQVKLHPEEIELLDKHSERLNIKKSRLISYIISGYRIPEKPDKKFYEDMGKIDDLIFTLDSLSFDSMGSDEIYNLLTEELKKWDEFRFRIENRYLYVRREIPVWLR